MKLEHYYIERTQSTNVLAKQLAKEGKASQMLVYTDEQISGYGRRSRRWNSSRGDDIAMSLLLRPEIAPTQAAMLTPVMGLGVARGLIQEFGLDARIKWPNDVIISDQKVCGILTEMRAVEGMTEYVIIGVGINCNTREFPEDIKDKATSLALLTGGKVKREAVMETVINVFAEYYERFLETGDLSALTADYNQILINRDRAVRVHKGDHSYTGIARGINTHGELLVETKDGIKNVFAEEVAVRGLDGYV